MFTFANHVGRLIEVRIDSLERDELPLFRARLAEHLQRVHGRFVACCDLRRAIAFTPEVEQWLIQLLRTDNPNIERNGLLVGRKGSFAMQVLRILTDAENRARRAFQERPPLEAFLDEVLTPDERQVMRRFLGEIEAPAADAARRARSGA
jgi:hypothetical protein